MITFGRLAGLVFGALTLVLTGCDDPVQTAAPQAQEPTRDDMGYYCHMIVIDHEGPKGQIYLSDQEKPIWFSSVRDVIAFTMLPEEPRNITAVYVNDTGQMNDWAHPGAGNWIKAKEALFVIGSGQRGGMGALETLPFSDQTEADAFAQKHGGRVVSFADIPRDYVFAEAVPDQDAHTNGQDHEKANEQTH